MSEVSTIPGYLTTFEVAQMLCVDHSQICRYCRLGEMPAVKVGNQWLIKPSDARAFKPNPRGNPNFQRSA